MCEFQRQSLCVCVWRVADVGLTPPAFREKEERSFSCLETVRYPPIWAALAPPCCWDLAAEWLSLCFAAKLGHLMNISNLPPCSADVWGENLEAPVLAEPAGASPRCGVAALPQPPPRTGLSLGEMEGARPRGELLWNCSCVSRRGVIPGTPAWSPSVLAGAGWVFAEALCPSMHRYLQKRGETRAPGLCIWGRWYRKFVSSMFPSRILKWSWHFSLLQKPRTKLLSSLLSAQQKAPCCPSHRSCAHSNYWSLFSSSKGPSPAGIGVQLFSGFFCSFILIFLKSRTSHTCVQTVFKNT